MTRRARCVTGFSLALAHGVCAVTLSRSLEENPKNRAASPTTTRVRRAYRSSPPRLAGRSLGSPMAFTPTIARVVQSQGTAGGDESGASLEKKLQARKEFLDDELGDFLIGHMNRLGDDEYLKVWMQC